MVKVVGSKTWDKELFMHTVTLDIYNFSSNVDKIADFSSDNTTITILFISG